MFFAPIEFSWNNRFQLASRSYIDFTTSYDYDGTYHVLNGMTTPDGVTSTYAYDSRWRLGTATTMNGRQLSTYDYSIGAGSNYVNSILSFPNAPEYASQETTQHLDGSVDH